MSSHHLRKDKKLKVNRKTKKGPRQVDSSAGHGPHLEMRSAVCCALRRRARPFLWPGQHPVRQHGDTAVRGRYQNIWGSNARGGATAQGEDDLGSNQRPEVHEWMRRKQMESNGAKIEWQTHTSDQGRPYYYNTRTGESTWDPPPAVVVQMLGDLAGAECPEQAPDAVAMHARRAVRDGLEADERGWRLDWEEDGRWIEWRMDEEQQSDEDRFRVTMEWTRFRNARGRADTNLWEDRSSGFGRGSASWWREQYYEYEYAGANGVSSMSAVKEACETLGISDAGDAGAVRATYLRLVNKWHPDRFHHHTAEEQSAAGAMFRKVQEAYELLRERAPSSSGQ